MSSLTETKFCVLSTAICAFGEENQSYKYEGWKSIKNYERIYTPEYGINDILTKFYSRQNIRPSDSGKERAASIKAVHWMIRCDIIRLFWFYKVTRALNRYICLCDF